MAIFSRLLPTLLTGYLVQTAGGLVSVPLQSERLYDVAGVIGFLASTFVSLSYESIKEGRPLASTIRTLSARQLLLNGAAIIWSARLVLLILGSRENPRLDAIRHKPLIFKSVWSMQREATWTFLIGLPVYLANTLCKLNQSPLGLRDYIPLGLFTFSFLLEVLSDCQKSRWRDNKHDKGKYNEKRMGSRIRSWSRHPNYAGEIGVWLGIWALAASALQHSSYPRLAPAIAAISPLLAWHLLTSSTVSKIPSREEKHAKRTSGNDPNRKNI